MRNRAENQGENRKSHGEAGDHPALSWGRDISELLRDHCGDMETAGSDQNGSGDVSADSEDEESSETGDGPATQNGDRDEIRRARQKALDLLADMDRTEAQLREKLRRKEFSAGAVDDAIAYVKRFGYINDTHYADHYIEVYRSRKSRRRILYDLQKKGLSKEVIDGAFEKVGWYDERPLIRELAEKKARSLDLSDPKGVRRLTSYLGRLGFSGQDIYAVLDEMKRSDSV
ncbi:MAG: regulatory protein RecX [Chordicoccus sp.]